MTNKTKTNKRKEKAYLRITLIIIILSLIFRIAYATPQIQLISQTNPIEYGEIQTITLNITNNETNTSIKQAIIQFDGINHTLQKENPYYTYSWVSLKKGTNTYKIYATDTRNKTQTYTSTFTVQDTKPPTITETQPQGKINYNLVELKAVTNENSTCKYDEVDVSYDSMYYALSGTGLSHTTLRSLSNGEHLFYVRCKDQENNIGQSQTISFTIDTLPPTISGITPTGTVNKEEATLRFNTNEIATCKWGINNEEYDNLDNQFQTTGATIHEQPLYLAQGINTYYLSCKDQIGNKNPTIVLNIELNLPPSATIKISKEDDYKVLRYGTYEISLLASESLSQTPTLKLIYNNKIINIPLEGSSKSWGGYLIIPENAGEHIGEFSYLGTDNKGTTGTEITSGKLAIIDTIPPAKPDSLRLANENNKIKLSWAYEGEDTDHFNIYRSTTGNTGKSNLKTTTQETTYQDADVTNKIGYFYRISAVDEAGNEGELSEEEFIMTEYQNTTTQFLQDPTLLAIINTKISQTEKTVQNLEVKITELEETTDQDLLQIINEQKLVNQLEETKNKIQNLIGELKTYRETKITKDELDAKIRIIDTKIEEYKKDIIKEVKVRSKVQNEQVLEENILQEAINEYLKNKALTEEQKEEYDTRTKTLQKEIRVLQELISYEIEYEYKESQRIISIKETILSSKDLSGILLQEYIPKEVLKISDITFIIQPDNINSLGVVWLLKDLENTEVSYTTINEKTLNQLQAIRTILLYDIDEFLSKISEEANITNKVTGETISEKKQGFSLTKHLLMPLGILVIIVLLIYYFVFLKTENMYENEIVTRLDEQERKALKDIKIPEIKKDHTSYGEDIISDSKCGLDTIILFIRSAYSSLEQNDIEGAYRNYSFVLAFYSHFKLSIKEKLKINFEINTLYDEIIKVTKAKHLNI